MWETKAIFHHYLDFENRKLCIKPWTPVSNHINVISTSNQYTDNNNSDDLALSDELSSLLSMVLEDLDKFVYTPAPYNLGDIQCRITRDKRGMEKGFYPTYYMHMERPNDSKRVCHCCWMKNVWTFCFY